MNWYSVALFFHLVGLLLATASTAITTYAAVELLHSSLTADGRRWANVIRRAAMGFPFATLLLVVTGAYMTIEQWTWLTPWIDASIVGLAMIVILGAVVERLRGRALHVELERFGMSAHARALVRDPAAWTARMTTIALVLAVMLEMTLKPQVGLAGAILAAGVVVGVLAAVPVWRRGTGSAPRGAAAQKEEVN